MITHRKHKVRADEANRSISFLYNNMISLKRKIRSHKSVERTVMMDGLEYLIV